MPKPTTDGLCRRNGRVCRTLSRHPHKAQENDSIMAARFVPIDRDTPLLLPPSLHEWLPPDDPARLVIDLVDSIDLSEAHVNDKGTGSLQYPPSMMLPLLLYCYSAGFYQFTRNRGSDPQPHRSPLHLCERASRSRHHLQIPSGKPGTDPRCLYSESSSGQCCRDPQNWRTQCCHRRHEDQWKPEPDADQNHRGNGSSDRSHRPDHRPYSTQH